MSGNNVAFFEYQQVREPGDRDLVAEVRQKLIQAGVPMESMVHFNNHQNIIDASNKKPEAQRFLLNRYWNIQLLNCPKTSADERFCLIPNGTLDDWMRLFEAKVLPFIITNGLPVAMS
jgi:hypothetical protein